MSAKIGARTEKKQNESINEYDRQADMTAAANTKIANMDINGQESSD